MMNQETEVPADATNNRKPLIAAAAVIILAGGAYAFSGRDKQWSDAETPIATTTASNPWLVKSSSVKSVPSPALQTILPPLIV